MAQQKYDFTLIVNQGRGLVAKDANGKSDPYITVSQVMSSSVIERAKSSTVQKTLDPDWRAGSVAKIYRPGITKEFWWDPLIQCWDKDMIGKDEFMGEVTLKLQDIAVEGAEKGIEKWLKLQPRAGKKDEVAGEILVYFKWEALEMPPPEPAAKKAAAPAPAAAAPAAKPKSKQDEIVEACWEDGKLPFGFTQENVSHIFEMFYKKEPMKILSTAPITNLYLGLAFAKQLKLGNLNSFLTPTLDKKMMESPIMGAFFEKPTSISGKWDNALKARFTSSTNGPLSSILWDVMDVNGDGELDMVDLIKVSAYYCGGSPRDHVKLLIKSLAGNVAEDSITIGKISNFYNPIGMYYAHFFKLLYHRMFPHDKFPASYGADLDRITSEHTTGFGAKVSAALAEAVGAKDKFTGDQLFEAVSTHLRPILERLYGEMDAAFQALPALTL